MFLQMIFLKIKCNHKVVGGFVQHRHKGIWYNAKNFNKKFVKLLKGIHEIAQI